MPSAIATTLSGCRFVVRYQPQRGGSISMGHRPMKLVRTLNASNMMIVSMNIALKGREFMSVHQPHKARWRVPH